MTTRKVEAPAAAATRLPSELALVVGLSFGCALIHLQAAVDHFDESVLYAVLFGLVAGAQCAWGLAVLRRPRPRLLQAGAVGMLGVVAAWAISRTVGLPVGPDTAGPEAAGLLDVLATVDEVMIVALIGVAALHRRPRAVGVLRALALMLVLLSSLAFAGGTHAH